MSKEQNASFTSSPLELSNSFEPYLNYQKVLTLQNLMFEEGQGMCGARKAWRWIEGGIVVGNCARMSFLVSDLVLPDSGWTKNTTNVFL